MKNNALLRLRCVAPITQVHNEPQLGEAKRLVVAQPHNPAARFRSVINISHQVPTTLIPSALSRKKQSKKPQAAFRGII